jgi:SAM-dependent methyltransferase
VINSNKEFWDGRYLECPALGSGPGSRGYVIVKKKRLVITAMEALTASSIIDVGCGDLCWLDIDFINRFLYIGLDISSVVIERNQKSLPNVKFAVHNIVEEKLPPSADLVVCFDVLIHQENYADFVNALKNILEAGRFGALISYKKSPSESIQPDNDRDMEGDGFLLEQQFESMRKKIGKVNAMKATYHGEIEKEIVKLFPKAQITKVDSYRSQNVFLVTGVAQ